LKFLRETRISLVHLHHPIRKFQMSKVVPWTKCDKQAYCKQSRASTGKFQLSLNKGDMVQVNGENSLGWSLCMLIHRDEIIRGIFPTDFLSTTAPQITVFKAPEASDTSRETLLHFETLQVLREWATELAKLKSEKRKSEYLEVKKQMAILVGLRRLLIDPSFAKMDIKARKEHADKILRVIEEGSRKLNLDLIVRVEKGENRGQRASEKNTPVISLYRLYRNIQTKEDYTKSKIKHREVPKAFEKLNEKLSKLSEKEKHLEMRLLYDLPETSEIQLLLDVKACIFTVGENTELYFSLYCKETATFISEQYMVEITPNGMPNDKRFLEFPMQTIFRDIQEQYYMKNIYIVCQIYRRGKLTLELDKIGTRAPVKMKEEEKLRRPFAVAVLEVTPPIISEHLITEARYQPKLIPIYTTNDIDVAFPILHELIINRSKDISQVSDKIAIGFALALQLSSGSFDSMMDKEENKGLKEKISFTTPLYFSEEYKPDISRNDFYITLEDGLFTVPNILIQVAVYAKTNEQKKCLSRFSTRFTEPSAVYESAVVLGQKPTFSEKIKINMDPETLLDSTAVLTFCQVKKDKPEPFGVGFFPLKNENKVLKPDSKYEIGVYKWTKEVEKNPK
jgi:hypothetical protein